MSILSECRNYGPRLMRNKGRERKIEKKERYIYETKTTKIRRENRKKKFTGHSVKVGVPEEEEEEEEGKEEVRI